MSELTGAELDKLFELLERVGADRGVMASHSPASVERLMKLCGEIARPDVGQRRQLTRARRKRRKQEKRERDEGARRTTGIRSARAASVFVTPEAQWALDGGDVQDAQTVSASAPLHAARTCYICKASYRTLHSFYDQLCPGCGDENYRKRHPTVDLEGRVALITGARVKIGYQAAIMLLRNGCHVIVTTRFPRDAATRYAQEQDFDVWRHRLDVVGLDLRHTPSVEQAARRLEHELSRLDFMIHNACQTVRRPAGFYEHLLQREREDLKNLPAAQQKLMQTWEAITKERETPAGLRVPFELSQAETEDRLLEGGDAQRALQLFPEGMLDADLQQVDLRKQNSWRMTMAQVPTVELLEVMLVNAVAPFVLSARLKPLMLSTSGRDKHIVNVSAMEGQFYRQKTDKHPHTNMAKAALNMLTRTSAQDYVKDGIHMNAVDTGWVTDEDPAHLAARKEVIHDFSPPLDIVDGAARIVDPIVTGLTTGEHAYGVFFKDYKPAPW